MQARHGDGLLDESSLLVECQATVTPDDGFIERICRLALFCRVVVVESRCGWQGKAILRGRAHHSIALFSFWRNFLFDCRTLSHRHFSIDEKIVQYPAWRPSSAVGPSLYLALLFGKHKDAARNDCFPFGVRQTISSSRYDASSTSLKYEESILSIANEPLESRLRCDSCHDRVLQGIGTLALLGTILPARLPVLYVQSLCTVASSFDF